MFADADEIRKELRNIELAIDASNQKHQAVMIDIWKMLRTINASLQDIAEAIRTNGAT